MAKEFTKHLNDKYVKKGELRIVFEMIPVDFDKLVPMLISGKADIIAVGLTRTKHREKKLGLLLVKLDCNCKSKREKCFFCFVFFQIR